MTPDPLPPSLRELEELLTRRQAPQPDVAMRDRVLSAMAAERGGRSQCAMPTQAVSAMSRRWTFAWRVAAAVVLLLNLSMSVATGVRIQSLQARGPERQVEPDDRFPAFATTAVAQLNPAPDAGLVCQIFFERTEN